MPRSRRRKDRPPRHRDQARHDLSEKRKIKAARDARDLYAAAQVQIDRMLRIQKIALDKIQSETPNA